MAIENLKYLYDQVFKKVKVHPQIQKLERGLLYNTIQIILMEERSQAQEKTKTWEICNNLGIKDSAYRDDDYKIIADLIDELFIDRQALARFMPGRDVISSISIKVNQSVTDEEGKMKWIVVAACTLVGVYFCIQYLKEIQQQEANRKREVEATKQQPTLPPPIPASLCLIVPAHIASNFKNDSNLSADNLMNLIDNASYFLCTSLKAANSNEQRLEMTDEDIPPDSKQEVYIRINIDDGRKLIDQKIPYILKTNLPAHAQCVVKQLACLRNLSGLESFNRV